MASVRGVNWGTVGNDPTPATVESPNRRHNRFMERYPFDGV
jgi:hypothetical protein